MTLAAPRSRQGKFALVLAILAAVTAGVAVFLWASQASANMPTTTLTLSQTPDSPATIDPGGAVSYDMTLSTTGTNTSGAIVMTLTVDADLTGTTVTCLPSPNGGQAWVGAGAGTSTLTCTSAAAATDVSGLVMHVAGTAVGDISAPSVATAGDGSGADVTATNGADVGPLTAATASCSGGGDFLVGSTQTVTCTVPAGLTYCSDNDTLTARTFVAGDMPVVLSGGATISTAQAAGLANDTLADTATVSVTGPIGSSASVTLSTHLSTSDAGPGDCTATPEQLVSFGGLVDIAGGGGAVLRHVDVDCGTERAFDSGNDHSSIGTGDYGSNVLTCNGLLSNGNIFTGENGVTGYAQDDPDDAVGSVHTVCILSSALTDANNPDIQWNITPNAPVIHMTPILKLGVDVSGNGNLEPCAQWAVGDVGVEQNITATYVPTGEVIYSNGVQALTGPNAGQCPEDTADGTIYGACQVLIKQWNSILDTKIVQDTGNRDGNDCGTPSADGASCANADLDGENLTFSGVTNVDGFVVTGDHDYIDYVLGAHADYYPGTGAPAPVDGAEQTYEATGECGHVDVEDPSDADNTFNLSPGESVTLPTNSDKGVGFTISPTDENTGDYNCVDGETTGVTISTIESSNFDSNDPFHPADEDITLTWTAGPGPEKQPLLAWVGQRVVLEHDWSDPATGECPYGDQGGTFFVRYLIQAPSPGALSNVPFAAPAEVTGPDFIIVPVSNEDCISHVIYESQNQGRVDVTAHVVAEPGSVIGDGGSSSQQVEGDWSVVSPEYDFWYYYMKIEDTTLTLVPGTRSDHNAGAFTNGGADVTSLTGINVSADVLLRVKVRGWVLADNCPQKPEGADVNGLLLPANRCTFPDDWAKVVGDDDQYDILGKSPGLCPLGNIAGPFSTLSGLPPQCNDDDSEAPHVDGGFRHSVFSNGTVGTEDAPMPPALITFNLTGSGFLHGADKADIYPDTNQYFDTHIPAEPSILVAGSGYQWHTWNGTGDRSGLYHFWTSLAGTGNAIVSCPGDPSDGCAGGVATGGYDMIQVYSDNHGEAMAWLNGDANLDFTGCDDNLGNHSIVLLSGHYCESGDAVGSSTVSADADYPDKKPHRDVQAANDVTVSWVWGGTKDISVVDDPADPTGQFNYVIFRVTDRDGGCSENNSLHPVLGENVTFLIDSPTGVIFHNQNGDASAVPNVADNSKTANLETFDSDIDTGVADGGISFDPGDDICEAWIHVSESQLNNVNVVVTAYDPEGTVTFDTKDINPTPTPSPVPTEEPPFTINLKWGDTDCGGTVASRDAQAILKRVLEQPELSNNQPCPSLGQMVVVDGVNYHWGDFDCSGQITTRDSQSILKNVLQTTALSQTEPCPDIGTAVDVEPISIP